MQRADPRGDKDHLPNERWCTRADADCLANTDVLAARLAHLSSGPI